MMVPIIRWTLNDQNMKDWPAGQAQGGPTLPTPAADLTRLFSELSISLSANTEPYLPLQAHFCFQLYFGEVIPSLMSWCLLGPGPALKLQ